MTLMPSDKVQAEAAVWLVRLQRPDRGAMEEAAFQDWLDADPSHAIAFEAMNSTWDAAAGLRHEGGVAQPRPPLISRRAALMSATATLAAGGSVALWQEAQAGVYQTQVGEQRHVALKDGTAMFLDTNTRLSVGFSAGQRTAELQYGRVNLRIARDAARPFIVNTSRAKIVAEPSNLDIRIDDARLSVLLIHGKADVMQVSAQAETLVDGDRIIVDAEGLGRRDRPALAPLLAWQTGQAIFENGLLSDAVLEMNRYSNVKLTISDPEVARLRISGIYAVGDNVSFARSVARLLPVKLVQGEDRIEVVSDRGRPAPG